MNTVQSSTLHQVLETFSSEMEKGKPDFRTLMDLMLTINMLFHNESANQNRQDLLELLKDLRMQVADAVNAQNPLGRNVAYFVCGAATLAAGGLGVAGTLNSNKLWVDMSQGLNTIAGTPKIAADVLTGYRDAAVQEKQAQIKETETKQQMLNQEKSENQRQSQQCADQAREADRVFHDIMNTLSQPVH